MADSPRVQELRRRVQQDPATLAFAPLAEELRRAGRLDEAISVCQAGLALHPEYVSARATLGRTLLESGDIEAAMIELMTVLSGAPENLTALRGVAEIYHRRGETAEALATYRRALGIVGRGDAELERVVAELERAVAAAGRATATPAATRVTLGAPVQDEAGRPHQVTVRRLEQFLGAILADRERRSARGQ